MVTNDNEVPFYLLSVKVKENAYVDISLSANSAEEAIAKAEKVTGIKGFFITNVNAVIS